MALIDIHQAHIPSHEFDVSIMPDETLHPTKGEVRDIPGLGQAECVDSRFLECDGMLRERQAWSINNDKYVGVVRVTEPTPDTSEAESPEVIFHVPGFTELVDAGTAKDLHDEIAKSFPHHRVVSIGTDGVSRYGATMDTVTALSRDFDEMAEARLDLIRHFSDGRLSILAGVSMGTVLSVISAGKNLLRQPEDQANIDQLVFISTAILDQDSAPKVMLGSFVGHMILSTPGKAVRHPRQTLNLLHSLRRYKREHVAALAGNVRNLIKGIDDELIDGVIDCYHSTVISGSRDPLVQLKQWLKRHSDAPHTLTLDIREGEGHALTLNSKEAAQLLYNAVMARRKVRLESNLPEAA